MFKYIFCLLLAVQHWTGYLTSLCPVYLSLKCDALIRTLVTSNRTNSNIMKQKRDFTALCPQQD